MTDAVALVVVVDAASVDVADAVVDVRSFVDDAVAA